MPGSLDSTRNCSTKPKLLLLIVMIPGAALGRSEGLHGAGPMWVTADGQVDSQPMVSLVAWASVGSLPGLSWPGLCLAVSQTASDHREAPSLGRRSMRLLPGLGL